MTELISLNLDAIVVRDDVQVRVAGLDGQTVQTYTTVLENGGVLAPLTVIRLADGSYVLADGFHRYQALAEVGVLKTLVQVKDGEEEDVLIAAEEGNLKHGLALTTEDKKNILRRRFERGHPWATYSNRKLGELLGVSATSIMRWMNEFAEKATVTNVTVPDRSVTVGKDGRTINTTNIGKTKADIKTDPPLALNDNGMVPISEELRKAIRDQIYEASYAGKSFVAPANWNVRTNDAGHVYEMDIVHEVPSDFLRYTTLDKGETLPQMPKTAEEAVARRMADVTLAAADINKALQRFTQIISLGVMDESNDGQRGLISYQLFRVAQHALLLWQQVIETSTSTDYLEVQDGNLFALNSVMEAAKQLITTQREATQETNHTKGKSC